MIPEAVIESEVHAPNCSSIRLNSFHKRHLMGARGPSAAISYNKPNGVYWRRKIIVPVSSEQLKSVGVWGAYRHDKFGKSHGAEAVAARPRDPTLW